MSLTAFNRARRMNQVEEMKPENIEKENNRVIDNTQINNRMIETDTISRNRRRHKNS